MSNKLVKPQQQNNVITINDGTKIYEIRNQRNELKGQFVFAPTDTNIIRRYDEVVEYFNNFSVPDDVPEDKAAEYAEDKLVDQISYLINADAKEAFFKHLGALSPLPSGYTYIEDVLFRISKVIEKELGVNATKVQRRMNKYTKKYHK